MDLDTLLNTPNIYWVAGLIEGEGCFTINSSNKNPYPRVQVAMTDKDVLTRLQAILKIGNIYNPFQVEGCKDKYIWSVEKRKDSVALMMMLYPLMGDRRKKRIKECLKIWQDTSYSKPNLRSQYSEIRKLYRTKRMPTEALARKYSVTTRQIYRIVNG